MYAVVVRVTIIDADKAVSSLNEEVVPGISQAPGFVAGYWTLKGDTGLSMIITESEDAANAIKDRVGSLVRADVVTVEDVEVREVVAQA
jgi:hypothetical protein